MNRVALLLLAFVISSFAQSTFHANNARTGVYEFAGPKQFTAVKWTFKAAGPIVTSPAIADGVIYIASLSGHMYAIDQETGKEKWNFKSRMPIASSPAVAGDTLLLRLFCRIARRTRPQDRAAKMGVRHRVRAKVRSQKSPRISVGRANHP